MIIHEIHKILCADGAVSIYRCFSSKVLVRTKVLLVRCLQSRCFSQEVLLLRKVWKSQSPAVCLFALLSKVTFFSALFSPFYTIH